MPLLPVLALSVPLLLAACSSTPDEVTDQTPPEGEADWTDPNADGADGAGGADGAVDVETTEGAEPAVTPLTPAEQLQQDLIEAGDRVFFDYDKSVFFPEGEETLRRQSEFLRANPGLTVTIEGHCDERGTREYNIALGERRAEAARSYLVSLGISPDRISTISYGKERPSVAGHSEASWGQNRVAITMVNP